MFQPFASLQLRLAGDRGSFFQSSWFLCTLHTHTPRADPTVSLTGIYSFAWHFSNTLSGHFSRSTLRDWAGGFAASGSVYWWFVRLVGLKHFLARPQPLVTKLFAPPAAAADCLLLFVGIIFWKSLDAVFRRTVTPALGTVPAICTEPWTLSAYQLRELENADAHCAHTHTHRHILIWFTSWRWSKYNFLRRIQHQAEKQHPSICALFSRGPEVRLYIITAAERDLTPLEMSRIIFKGCSYSKVDSFFNLKKRCSV